MSKRRYNDLINNKITFFQALRFPEYNIIDEIQTDMDFHYIDIGKFKLPKHRLIRSKFRVRDIH